MITPEEARLTQLAVADRQAQGGGAFLNVSRMRDPIKNRLTRSLKLDWSTLDSVQASRSDGRIAAFEEVETTGSRRLLRLMKRG